MASVIHRYRALAGHHNVARSTLHDRAHGQRSKEQKAQSQQYLTVCEEKAVVNFLLHMAEFGHPSLGRRTLLVTGQVHHLGTTSLSHASLLNYSWYKIIL